MHQLAELHEQIDEVNYFVKELQKLRSDPDSSNKVLQKPEIRFISHALKHVLYDARSLDIKIVLRFKPEATEDNMSTTFLGDSRLPAEIPITDYHQVTNDDGNRVSYIGNPDGLLSLPRLSEIIYTGGHLAISGPHEGDWGD